MILKYRLLTGALLLPTGLFAHHSVAATFDNTTVIELEGRISDTSWRNPRVHFTIDVATVGGVETWQIEATSLSNL